MALYPQVQTPLRPAPEGKELNPPPPAELLFIGVRGAEIPRRTRDGRDWDELGSHKPDPFAKVFFGERELFRTETQTDTFAPTWPLTPTRNFRVPPGEVMRVELWNDNPINNQPICVRIVDDVREAAGETGEFSLDCEGGGRIQIEARPGRPKFGLGFTYQLREGGASITGILEQSPAERAGLRAGDELVEVAGKPVSGLSPEALRSAINANARQGLELKVRAPGKGSPSRAVRLEEGPIYSLELE
jgi:PDZ domain